jgi:GT2 family glycosyltransferase
MSVDAGEVMPTAVIVPSRGRPQLLSECVESILAGTPLPAEIVVVDQSDTPHAQLADLGNVRGCQVIYHHSSLRGSSAARNEGCRLATQDILMFTDDDILVAPDWVEAMTRAVQREADSTLMSGRIRFIATDQVDGFAPSLFDEEEPRLFEGRFGYEVLFGGNMGFHRRILEDLGPFDERFGGGAKYLSAEDNDYSRRALDAGYRIRYVPEALVHHQAWRAKRDERGLMWAYGVGHGAFLAKHFQVGDSYIPIRFREELRRCLRKIREKRRSDPVAAKDELVYTLGLLYGSARWILLERLAGRRA